MKNVYLKWSYEFYLSISIIVFPDEICGYTVYKSHNELPFKVDLVDRLTGGARIILAAGYKLNFERRRRYLFEIAAHDCVTGKHAPR